MRNTLQYILKKLLFMIPMVLFITFLIYLGLYLTPGDANDPFFVQYFKWLWQLLCGNFGYSLTNGQPISSLLKQYFPATLELSLAALIISSVLGSILGILSALKKGSIGDNVLTVAGMIGVSIPQFFFGMVCVLVFAIHLGVLPIGGRTAPGITSFIGRLKFLVMPACVLGISLTRESGARLPRSRHPCCCSDRLSSADSDQRLRRDRVYFPVARRRQRI